VTAGEDTMDARREGRLGGRVRVRAGVPVTRVKVMVRVVVVVVVVVPRCHECERGSGSGYESLSAREW